MTIILSLVKDNENIEFERLFNIKEGRLGVIDSFLAILHWLKNH